MEQDPKENCKKYDNECSLLLRMYKNEDKYEVCSEEEYEIILSGRKKKMCCPSPKLQQPFLPYDIVIYKMTSLYIRNR